MACYKSRVETIWSPSEVVCDKSGSTPAASHMSTIMNCHNINPPSTDSENERRAFDFDRSLRIPATLGGPGTVCSIPEHPAFRHWNEGLRSKRAKKCPLREGSVFDGNTYGDRLAVVSTRPAQCDEVVLIAGNGDGDAVVNGSRSPVTSDRNVG